MLEEVETTDGAREVDGEDDGNIGLFRLNPFLQPPILKALFEHLPSEDLARCRLVSKLWYDESLSTWRSNATLKFEYGRLVCTRDDGSRSRQTYSLREFLDLWEAGKWDSCPFKRFRFSWWNFKTGDLEQDRFMEVVGSHVTWLTLGWCSYEGRESFRRIISQPFPKLQFLKMEKCDVWDRDEANNKILEYNEPAFGVHGLKSLDIFSCSPQTMMDMLSHFHKLKHLHMRPNEPSDYMRLLDVIRLIRAQDPTKLPLTNFDVTFKFKLGRGMAFSVELLRQHDELNLPLQRLEIYSNLGGHEDNNIPNVISVSDILRDHSSTLKYLNFSGPDMYGLCKSFPFGFNLENLEKLFILTGQFCDNLNYLRYTPNLRVLDIRGYGFGSPINKFEMLFANSAQLEIGDWILPALTDLTLFSPLSLCDLEKLMKWMPNVERLSNVEVDDVKFAMVCNNWKNLKHLRVGRGFELTDEGVIGMENVHEADGNEGTQRVPNITKLKNLTSFSTCSPSLTSASVHEGFLKLDNLKELSLGDFTELDDEAKAVLEERKISLKLTVSRVLVGGAEISSSVKKE